MAGRRGVFSRLRRVFVTVDFVVPLGLETPQFQLEPLGPEHNDPDDRAWSSSMEHIHATPGWEKSSWPREMTLEENCADMQRHANDLENLSGFTYTVLEPGGDVVGCVYIYPPKDERHDVHVESWVRASHADLDEPLWLAVSDWLAADWPFEKVDYAAREGA